jgi:hypothetical protein
MRGVWYLAVAAAVCAAAAIYGGIAGVELLLGIGAAAGFLCLIFIPVTHARTVKTQRIRQRDDALIVFDYARGEVDEIVSAQRRIALKKSRSLSILFSICIAVIFAPFCVITRQSGDGQTLWIIAVICIVLPWLSLLVGPAAAENRLRRTPCTSVIGRDYILVTNKYHGVNDRHQLTAVETQFQAPRNGGMATLRIRYRFLAMNTPTRTFYLWVDVPVPRGREEEAKGLALEAT